MNIVLTGFMATGKTAVGEILSRRLGWVFMDTDALIEKQTGHSIADLFARGGEPAFRDLESQAVGLVALLDKTVIATGGGVPLRPSNMAELEKNGRVFLLTAEPETVMDRLRWEKDIRPLLKDADPRGRIRDLLASREAAYARCQAAIPTDGLSPEQVADRILAVLPVSVTGAKADRGGG